LGSSTITLQYMAMYGLYFALAQYLQLAHGYSPIKTAFVGLPVGLFAMIGAPVSARSVGRFGPRRVVGTGLLVSGSGLVLLGLTSSPTVSITLVLAGFCLVGLGNGQTTAPSTTLIMSSVPRAKSGVGSAVNDLSRELGGALGIAVLGSVIASLYRSGVARRLRLAPLAMRQAAHQSVASALAASRFQDAHGNHLLAQTVAHASRSAFAQAFGRAMLIGALVIFINAALVWVFQARHEPRHERPS